MHLTGGPRWLVNGQLPPHTRDPHDFGEETYVHWLDKNGFPGRDVDVHPGQWVVRVGHTFTVLSRSYTRPVSSAVASWASAAGHAAPSGLW
jgi:hypothetical protein